MNYKDEGTGHLDFQNYNLNSIEQCYISDSNLQYNLFNTKKFDKDYLNQLSQIILNSTSQDQINDSLIALQKYFQKYPKESLNIFIDADFFAFLFQKLTECINIYTNSILRIFHIFFIHASPTVVEQFVSDEHIFFFIFIIQNYSENQEIFCSTLLILSSLLNKSLNLSKKIIDCGIWTNLIQIENRTSYLNDIFKSSTYQKFDFNDEFLQNSQKRMEEIQKIEEEENKKQKDEQKELNLVDFNNDFFLYQHYKTNLDEERENHKNQVQARNKEKSELYEILYYGNQIPLIEYRATLFKTIFDLIKIDFNSIPIYIEFADLLKLLLMNFFQEQDQSILSSILQSFEYIVTNHYQIFNKYIEKEVFLNHFVNIISIDDKFLINNCLNILLTIINDDFQIISFDLICSYLQRALYSKDQNNSIRSLQILQKYSPIKDYFQILNDSRIFSQICALLTYPSHTISFEAFKTFFYAIHSLNDQQFLKLISQYRIVDTCSEFIYSDDLDCILISLKMLFRLIQIINKCNDLEYIFISFEQKCDLSELESFINDGNQEIAEQAQLLLNEIDQYRKKHN